MDLTSQLPDEVLCQVLSKVSSSIPGRFRLAAVNRKFRRCVFKEIKKPEPLEIDLWRESLCGYHPPMYKWPAAMEVLAKEARFSRINMNIRFNSPAAAGRLSAILDALATNPDCLSQVTQLKVDLSLFDSYLNVRCANGLASVIGSCDKLSVLVLNFTQIPLHRAEPWNKVRSPLDLARALNDKPLTELNVQLTDYGQQDVVDLFRAIKPNTLRTLKMSLDIELKTVEVADLVRELSLVAFESLNELELTNIRVRVEQPAADLFASIPHLPPLHSFSTSAKGKDHRSHQFVFESPNGGQFQITVESCPQEDVWKCFQCFL